MIYLIFLINKRLFKLNKEVKINLERNNNQFIKKYELISEG